MQVRSLPFTTKHFDWKVGPVGGVGWGVVGCGPNPQEAWTELLEARHAMFLDEVLST